MRKAVLVVLALVAATGCDPLIQKFEIVPQQVNCSGPVTITYQGQGDDLHLKASQPVSPPIPDTALILPKAGTQIETVSQTTEFSLYYPGAGHREKTVTVTHNNCGGGPGPGPCGPSQMTFNGTCFNAQSGPQYDMHSLSVAVAPGALVNITSNADFPVHVQHALADIAVGAGGGPLPPGIPPGTPAAGSYTIYVPGQVGMLVCQGAGPTQGSFPAPPVTLTITPTCPMP